MAKETIDKLAKALAETLPEGLRSVREDLEKNFRSVLQGSIGRLDLVTREELLTAAREAKAWRRDVAGEGLDEYADGLRPAYDRANRALARLEYLDQLERLDAGVVA